MNNLVFVYGTLKKGFGNHSFMKQAKGKLLGNAETIEEYTMHNINGWYPGVKKQQVSTIKGELYIVKDLDPLDYLEGHPEFFQREEVMIEGPDGDVSAWMYFYPENDVSDDFQIISEGEWHY